MAEVIIERPLPGLTRVSAVGGIDEQIACGVTDADGSVLIGAWGRNQKFEPVPDTSGDYAARVHGQFVTVLWSRSLRRVGLTQLQGIALGDLERPGEYLTFDLDPACYWSRDDE